MPTDLEQKSAILAETRAAAAQFAVAVNTLFHLRSRYDANGAADTFKGVGSDFLFQDDGTGQAISWNNFLGLFNALGGIEANGLWLALVAQAERTRG